MSTADEKCPFCGENVNPESKFCGSCGKPLEGEQQGDPTADEATRVMNSPEASATTQIEEVNSRQTESKAGRDANDFVEALKGYASLPGVRLATLASLIGVGIVLAFGLLVTILLPDNSFLSYDSDDSIGLLREVLLQAAGTSLGGFEFGGEGQSLTLHSAPLLFFLVPIGGVATGVYLQLRNGLELPARSVLMASAGAGVPFAILMAIIALLASGEVENGGYDLNVSVSATFLLSLCAGAIGGAIGALVAPRDPDTDDPMWPESAREHAGLVAAILKPLGILLIAASLLGALVWSIQSIRDVADARGDRGVGTAIVDSFAFSGDLGVRNVGLGTLATFKLTGLAENVSTPLPVETDGEKVSDLAEHGKFNLFDYKNVMHTVTFIVLLVVLIGLPILLSLYSGFLVGRNRDGGDPRFRVAWGAAVGPVWALAIVVLNALSEDVAFGHLLGDSVFALVLLGGAVLGAAGAFIAGQSSDTAEPEIENHV
jgi:hypothetical protein